MRTKRVIRLWERMKSLYGSRWEIEYGPALRADDELSTIAGYWADALEDLPNNRIGAGIRACIDRDNPSPPSMPEFLRLCGYRPSSAQTAYQQLPPASPVLSQAESLSHRCERLAAELQAKAESELYPDIAGYPPEDHRKAVARYWITKIAASNGAIAKSLLKQQEVV